MEKLKRSVRMLFNGEALADKQKRLVNIVKNRCRTGIDERQISVDIRQMNSAVELFKVGRKQLLCLNGAFALCLCNLLLNKVGKSDGITADFVCRRNYNGIRRIYTSLTLGVKRRKAVYTVTPEFNSVRVSAVGRKNINYSAPDGELTRAVNLAAPCISGIDEPVNKLILLDGFADGERYPLGDKLLGRNCELQSRLNRADNRTHTAIDEMTEHAQSGMFIITGFYVVGAQGYVSGRIHDGIAAKGIEIFTQLIRRAFVGRYNYCFVR